MKTDLENACEHSLAVYDGGMVGREYGFCAIPRCHQRVSLAKYDILPHVRRGIRDVYTLKTMRDAFIYKK